MPEFRRDIIVNNVIKVRLIWTQEADWSLAPHQIQDPVPPVGGNVAEYLEGCRQVEQRRTSGGLYTTREHRRFVPIDPWQLRDRFLALDLTARPEIVDFLDTAGYFHDAGNLFLIPKEELELWRQRQRALRDWMSPNWKVLKGNHAAAIVEPMTRGSGIAGCFSSALHFEDGVPVLVIFVASGWEAIVATIHIDKLLNLKFTRCTECGIPIPSRSAAGQPLRFCTKCRGVARQRRFRKRGAKSA